MSFLKPSVTTIQPNSLTQFVFDNADVNIGTFDRTKTFHAMGGIQVTTPKPLVSLSAEITRALKRLSAADIAEFGSIPVITFHNAAKAGLSNITIRDIDGQLPISSETLQVLAKDFLWLYGK